MAPEPRPPFATFLLPPFTYPYRRRESSTTSTSSFSIPSLYSSPTSSPGTTPSSSPPNALFTLPNWKGKGILYDAFQKDALHNTSSLLPSPKQRLRRAHPNTLKCLTCSTDIAFTSQVVSKGFTGRHGRAYLVSPPLSSPYNSNSNSKTKTKTKPDLVNTKIGRSVSRDLLTGAHVVADVSCTICNTVLGWKYVDAKELAQRYKIGKFILEMKRVVLGVSWEDTRCDFEDGERDGVGVYEGMVCEGGEIEGDVVFDSGDEDECDDIFAGVWDAEAVAKRRGRRVVVRRKYGGEEEEAV